MNYKIINQITIKWSMKDLIRLHHHYLIDENVFQHALDNELFHNPEIPTKYVYSS